MRSNDDGDLVVTKVCGLWGVLLQLEVSANNDDGEG